MILTSIKLKNFRSHKHLHLNFSEKLNFIIGGNGEGKTTILEAIYYLCTTKSDSSKSDSEVVRFNEDEFEIDGLFLDKTDTKARIYYSMPENKKYYFKDNKQILRSADVIGKFPVVLLTPSDHSITQGSPSDRRKFVDSVISQASENYLKLLLEYNKILRQRSSLLFQLKENRSKDLLDELDAWTEKLVTTGSEIIRYRQKFVSDFREYILGSYSIILENNEFPDIQYYFLEGYTDNNPEQEFRRILDMKRNEELRRASNLAGPHRDDFLFKINNLDLRTYGSQGQHKTFQVVLRFAEFFYLKEVLGTTPLFLLDDVFGELDTNRSLKISEYLRQVGQAFITLTDFTNISFLNKNETDFYIKLQNGIAEYA